MALLDRFGGVDSERSIFEFSRRTKFKILKGGTQDLRLVWKKQGKRWLFSVTLRRGTFSSTAIEIIKWVKKFAVAKVCGDLRLD
jgi:hypothetical protein